jgi:hypothetical protein
VTRHPPVAAARIALAAAAVLVAATCSPGPSAPVAAAPGRIAADIGLDDDYTLVLVDGHGAVTALPPPPGDPVMVATSVDGRLAVTTSDRRVFVSDAARTAWSEVALDVPAEAAAAELLMLAWSAGGPLAILFTDPEDVRTIGIGVTDPGAGLSSWIPLTTGLGGGPPAWIGRDRLAIPTRDDRDSPTLTTVDVATGAVQSVVAGPRMIAASSDGTKIAILTADWRTIEVWSAAAWAADDTDGREAVIGPDPGPAGIDGLALDPTGRHLAVALSTRDLTDAASLRIYGAASAWRAPSDVDLGAGVVTSLGWVT